MLISTIDLGKILSNAWDDPVWSKVISVFICALITIIWDHIKQLDSKGKILIPLSLFIISLVIYEIMQTNKNKERIERIIEKNREDKEKEDKEREDKVKEVQARQNKENKDNSRNINKQIAPIYKLKPKNNNLLNSNKTENLPIINGDQITLNPLDYNLKQLKIVKINGQIQTVRPSGYCNVFLKKGDYVELIDIDNKTNYFYVK